MNHSAIRVLDDILVPRVTREHRYWKKGKRVDMNRMAPTLMASFVEGQMEAAHQKWFRKQRSVWELVLLLTVVAIVAGRMQVVESYQRSACY